jgi:SAM-dependent methyltransferase
MQRGWGDWSPFEREVGRLPNAWIACSAEQCRERPYDLRRNVPELDLLLEVAARHGGPVLDLACGNGRFALALARHGYDVVGLDLNAAFIQRAGEEAATLAPEAAARLRFEVGDARAFQLPERFGLVAMMDQSFKYLLLPDDQLDCLQRVRDHLQDDGRFLVEHRCLFKLPDAGPGDAYAFPRGEAEWLGVDTYDPILQIGVSALQPLDAPDAEPELEPCRDFTYAELALLHRVVGFELETVFSDLDERAPDTTYFDAALLLKKCEPWTPGGR